VTVVSQRNQNLVLLENSKQQTNSFSMFIVLEVLHAKITFLGKGPLLDHAEPRQLVNVLQKFHLKNEKEYLVPFCPKFPFCKGRTIVSKNKIIVGRNLATLQVLKHFVSFRQLFGTIAWYMLNQQKLRIQNIGPKQFFIKSLLMKFCQISTCKII
jgi:hypothetical protein